MSEHAAPERDASGRFLPASARSPERLRLAARIAQLGEAEERLAGTRAALAKADDLWREARASEARAESALTEAREGNGRWLADQLRTDAVLGASPLKAAETALTEARDAVTAASAAGEVLQAQADEDGRIVESARRQLRTAAAEVLRASGSVETAIERLEVAQAELAAAGAVVMWLQTSGVIETWSPTPGGLGGLAVRAREAQHGGRLPEARPVVAAWEDALAALLLDPDAPAPCP